MELLEVYRVIYEGPDEIGKVSGHIEVQDDVYGARYIYKEEENVPRRAIQPREDLILMDSTGGPISLKNSGSIIFDYYLFDGVFQDGVIYRPFPPKPGMLSVPFHRTIFSKDCGRTLRVLCAAFEKAIIAKVKVYVCTQDDVSVVVEGVMTASTSAIEHPDYISFLFYQSPDNAVKLESGKQLPLSRCQVVAPLGSQLFFDISLDAPGPDKVEIFKGSFTIDVKKNGTTLESMPGKRSRIFVDVTWESQY